jgi:hypothetical protein
MATPMTTVLTNMVEDTIVGFYLVTCGCPVMGVLVAPTSDEHYNSIIIGFELLGEADSADMAQAMIAAGLPIHEEAGRSA